MTLPAVTEAFNNFLSCQVTPSDIDTLRDSAIKLEDVNLLGAYKLMLIAQKNRPSGMLINQKVKDYKEKLK